MKAIVPHGGVLEGQRRLARLVDAGISGTVVRAPLSAG